LNLLSISSRIPAQLLTLHVFDCSFVRRLPIPISIPFFSLADLRPPDERYGFAPSYRGIPPAYLHRPLQPMQPDVPFRPEWDDEEDEKFFTDDEDEDEEQENRSPGGTQRRRGKKRRRPNEYFVEGIVCKRLKPGGYRQPKRIAAIKAMLVQYETAQNAAAAEGGAAAAAATAADALCVIPYRPSDEDLFDYRVRWEGYGAADDTWQPFTSIAHIWRAMSEEQRAAVPMWQQYKRAHPNCPRCAEDDDEEDDIMDESAIDMPRPKRRALRKGWREDGPLLSPAPSAAAAAATDGSVRRGYGQPRSSPVRSSSAAAASPSSSPARSTGSAGHHRSRNSSEPPVEIDMVQGHAFVSAAEPLSSGGSSNDEADEREEREEEEEDETRAARVDKQEHKSQQRPPRSSHTKQRKSRHSSRDSASASASSTPSHAPRRGRPSRPFAPAFGPINDVSDDAESDVSAPAPAPAAPAAVHRRRKDRSSRSGGAAASSAASTASGRIFSAMSAASADDDDDFSLTPPPLIARQSVTPERKPSQQPKQVTPAKRVAS
jgi:hypothetical protein